MKEHFFLNRTVNHQSWECCLGENPREFLKLHPAHPETINGPEYLVAIFFRLENSVCQLNTSIQRLSSNISTEKFPIDELEELAPLTALKVTRFVPTGLLSVGTSMS